MSFSKFFLHDLILVILTTKIILIINYLCYLIRFIIVIFYFYVLQLKLFIYKKNLSPIYFIYLF